MTEPGSRRRQSRRELLAELVRFSVAGIAVVATDFAVYSLLLAFTSTALAKTVSFACGGLVGYLTNKYWTFHDARASAVSIGELGRFWVVNLTGLAVNVGTNEAVLAICPACRLPAFAAAAALTAAVIYLGQKLWVFATVQQRQ